MKTSTEKLERSVQQIAFEIARNGEWKFLERVIEGYYKRLSQEEKSSCNVQEFGKLIEEKLSKLSFVAKG